MTPHKHSRRVLYVVSVTCGYYTFLVGTKLFVNIFFLLLKKFTVRYSDIIPMIFLVLIVFCERVKTEI